MPPENSRRLIINADDLGLARSVNRGIAEVIACGNVQSASLMVNMDASADAVQQLAPLRERGVPMGIGLHFNIVAGLPLTGARSLIDTPTGAFRPLSHHVWRAWLGRIDLADVAAELDAQLDRAEELLEPLGLRVTHVDSHRHAHSLPGIADVVIEGARMRGIAHVRNALEAGDTLLRRPSAHARSAALRLAVGHAPRTDDVRFAGIALMASRTVESDLLQLVAALPIGDTELMMHPGYDSAELAALDPYRAPRERELRALTSPRLASALRQSGTTLSHFGASATSRPGR